jgi:hypothetical protein
MTPPPQLQHSFALGNHLNRIATRLHRRAEKAKKGKLAEIMAEWSRQRTPEDRVAKIDHDDHLMEAMLPCDQFDCAMRLLFRDIVHSLLLCSVFEFAK